MARLREARSLEMQMATVTAAAKCMYVSTKGMSSSVGGHFCVENCKWPLFIFEGLGVMCSCVEITTSFCAKSNMDSLPSKSVLALDETVNEEMMRMAFVRDIELHHRIRRNPKEGHKIPIGGHTIRISKVILVNA